MTDYIKREDALDIVADNNVHGEITLNRYDKIIDGIYDIPSADVAPVRRGRWVPLTDCSNDGIYCSACHKKVYRAEYSNTMKMHSPYCPNCGAKMDEENE